MRKWTIILGLLIPFVDYTQTKLKNANKVSHMNTEAKMKVEIWSDIMCPFCYIGKRNYEEAMKQFADSANIELEWHSFQLDPNLPKPASKLSTYEYLAQRKGMSTEQSKAMHDNVVKMAKAAGLNYNFDKAVVANSFDAHRLIQFAKTKGLGDEAEERLFKAYFTEGKDMCDATTLMALAKDMGLDENEAKEVILGKAFTEQVNKDIAEAAQLGVNGVPFFVFDRKYAVSGAQPSESFINVLIKSFKEWHQNNPNAKLQVKEGKVCSPEKGCE